MKNIFAKFQDYVKKPKRNVFDMTFRNNLTLKFGELTPVFCKEVIPGDSFKIDTTFGLMLMPMKFPVQTPMKAYVHYFYVRNRNTWKDWMDFIGGTKENLVPPYVQPLDKKKFYRVGGLADYLGVPNTLYKDEGTSELNTYPVIGVSNSVVVKDDNDETIGTVNYQPFVTTSWVEYNFLHYIKLSDYRRIIVNNAASTQFLQTFIANASSQLVGTTAKSDFNFINNTQLPNPWNAIPIYWEGTGADQRVIFWSLLGRIDRYVETQDFEFEYTYKSDTDVVENTSYIPLIAVRRNSNNVITSITGRIVLPTLVSSVSDGNNKYDVTLKVTETNFWSLDNPVCEFYTIFPQTISENNNTGTINISGLLVNGSNVVMRGGVSLDDMVSIIGDGELSNTPYDSAIHLSALPFRAYESIYNAYYRNPQNNPFVLNGTPEYNKYITTNEGGADITQYDLYYRNWEYDFLTSAVQSPQQGIAPLVGMSMTGEATFADDEGNTFYAQAILNDNGEITGWQSHSSNMPVGSLRLLMDMANTGISINDLRNVNAFQRFLENNIRHGLKYRDQLMSHFGVKARYDELDMPEFIGGVSGSMEVYKVSQTSNDGDTPLGSFVGQAQIKVESNHSVTHYCDEHGFIIGIMSVVPVPVYSQLLPKYFTKSSQLDYFFPEFGHIGYQPILQKEVSPLQTFYADQDLNKVFGYNRAWYDYLASTDEVHAQFRTTMRDFIMNRTFKTEPELGEDFLLVDPNQLNDVFLAGNDDDLYAPEADKIIGSLLFNVSAKRPIPLFGIPKLEA